MSNLIALLGGAGGLAVCGLALFILFRGELKATAHKTEMLYRQMMADKDEALVDNEREITQLKTDLSETQADRDQAWPSWELLKVRCAELERMKRVWLGNGDEESCRDVLMDNLWVLEPNFVYRSPTKERNIDNTLRHLFGGDPSQLSDTEFRFAVASNDLWRPDVCGWADVGASLQPNLSSEKQVLLLIELKASYVPINRKAIEQALVYAFALMMKAEKELWGRPIECLVIGHEIAEDVNDLHLRIGKTTHGAVRITPLTYELLIKRAATNLLGYFPTQETTGSQAWTAS